MKKIIIYLVIAAAIVAGVFYYKNKKGTYAPSTSPSPSVTVSILPSSSASPAVKPSPTRTPTASPTPKPGLNVNEVKIWDVSIKGFAFSPSIITVKRGDVIQFANNDGTTHTVTSSTGKFDSGSLAANATWTLTTASLTPGSYPYHCSIHTTMQGTVVVQ